MEEFIAQLKQISKEAEAKVNELLKNIPNRGDAHAMVSVDIYSMPEKLMPPGSEERHSADMGWLAWQEHGFCINSEHFEIELVRRKS